MRACLDPGFGLSKRIIDMSARHLNALVLVLSATPLLLLGCGNSGNNNATGGSGGDTGIAIKYDGGGAGGAELDVGVPDTTPPTVDRGRISPPAGKLPTHRMLG
jgi:hypothetical protein